MEVMYGIDEVEIEDNLIQLEFTRERTFINLKTSRYIKDHRNFYTDKSIMNDPLFIIFFGMQPEGKVYERKVYGLLDMLGNVGGLAEFMHLASMLIVYVLCSNLLDIKYVSIFQNNILSWETITPDNKGINELVKELNGWRF